MWERNFVEWKTKLHLSLPAPLPLASTLFPVLSVIDFIVLFQERYGRC